MPKTYTMRQLAEQTGVSKETIRRAVVAGNIKAVGYGLKKLISEEEFTRVVSEGFTPGPALHKRAHTATR